MILISLSNLSVSFTAFNFGKSLRAFFFIFIMYPNQSNPKLQLLHLHDVQSHLERLFVGDKVFLE